MIKPQFLAVLCLFPACLSAQIVEAHYAQYLVTSEMSLHAELQKMGVHVIPPNALDEIIVACSVPSKIGKKSSPADLEEERSGKSFVKMVTEGSFYDLALLLSDQKSRAIGAVVMELPFSAASSPEDAVHKAEAIRDEMQRQIPSREALFNDAPPAVPLALLRTIPLPDIIGDFDHFAIDHINDRLYVAAEEHHSIEVFNLKTGEHLQSVGGVTTPHTIAFVPEKAQLLIADGGDGSCRVFDVRDMREAKRIPLEAGPDAGLYDPEKRVFYIGNGGRRARQAFSFVSIVSANEEKEIGRIRVETANLESMALNRAANLLYVNMQDKSQIAVVDLAKNEVRQIWSIANLNLNTTMAFDAQHHRLFVAGRKPGKLFIINSDSGDLVSTVECIETADDMIFDPEEARIYITGAGGITVVHQDSADRYSLVTQFATNCGKTSIYDSALRQFYIAHTKTPEDKAAPQVYAVR